MKRSKVLFGILIACAAMIIMASCGISAKKARITGFSADEVGTDMNGKPSVGLFTKKVYYKDHKIRWDIINHGKPSQIIIYRGDTGIGLVISPRNKQYIEQPGAYNYLIQDPANIKNIKKVADVKELGTETIDGYSCRKIKYSFHNKQAGEITLWIAKELNYPVKMFVKASNGGGYAGLKNINKQVPSDSMFEIPRGYKKMPSPKMPKSMK